MSYSPLAPILRGALRTKGCGPLVLREPKTDAADAANTTVLELPPNSSDEQTAEIAGKLFSTVRSKENIAPVYVDAGDAGFFRIVYPQSDAVGRLTGRVALVTGGAQGFGEEIVRNLLAENARVFIADINIEKAGKLADELNSKFGYDGVPMVWAVKVDVSNEESVASMVDTVVDKAGGLDLFVNNAGVLRAGSVKTLEQRDFDFVTSINYSAYFLCVKHFSTMMAFQNAADSSYYSDIIQINSKSGLQGSNKNAAYAGGKFGGVGLTQSFAMELIEDNIKVNAICPGNFFEGPLWSDPDRGLFVQYLRTGKVPGAKTIEDVKAFYEAKVPMGRGCRGEDVARAIFYAVEQKYETGQAIPVTGGQVMLN